MDLKVLRDCDGLTVVLNELNDVRSEHLVGAAVITENGDCVILRVEDPIMEEVLKDLMDMGLRSKVVGVVSDAGSDCNRARRLITEANPELLSIDCLSRQCNLLIADVFKSLPSLKSIAADSVSVINWFNNHSGPRDFLRMEQREQYSKSFLFALMFSIH